jgi:CheY-like chemotaxis protein
MTDTQRYDLILMDCQMPDLDGYQTTALIRAAEDNLTHTPIIGWSSRANRNERDTCLAIGMDDFIAKPMRIRPLNEILVRWLRRSVADEAITQPDDELDTTQEMFGDDFAELAQLFRHDSPKRIVSLHDAVLEGDAVAIVKLAHVLCGSSASLGATTLAALCRELEVSARNSMLNEAHQRLTAIEIEYARIDARLSGMLQGDAQGNPSSSR